MPQITRELLRKRAEHNEGIISTLEEITLHQEELESINEVLGMTCRKLKILYLQNNIIPRIENLTHCKELEYVNLALNNIRKIEGLQTCEFLKKLDLTVNFIDVDELEASIDHLVPRDRLKDLFLMGNPAEANWPGFKAYVIAKLPQLSNLDGVEITRSMQIQAMQRLPELESELRSLARAKRIEKQEATLQGKKLKKKATESRVVELDENENPVLVEDASDDEEDLRDQPLDPDELTDNTPEVRERIYRELAAQKREKAERDKANMPRERDYEKEQQASIETIRRKEEDESEVKQKNEGNFSFSWDEESKPGMLILTIPLPRHLDSSLIDVDVHPTYVSVIVKSKVLRLRTLCEVKAEASKCQRAKVNGALMIIMPKVNAKENVLTHNLKYAQKTTSRIDPQGGNANPANARSTTNGFASSGNISAAASSRVSSTSMRPKKLSMQEQMIADAQAAAAAAATNSTKDATLLSIGTQKAPSSSAVDINNIVKRAKQENETGLLTQDNLETVFKKTSLIAELD